MRAPSVIALTAGLLLVMAACEGPQPAPTPTATPTPVPLTAPEILALSRQQMEKVETLRVEMSGRVFVEFDTYGFKLDAEMQLPDRAHGTIQSTGQHQEFLLLGEETYTAEPGYGFEIDDYHESGAGFLELLKLLMEPEADETFNNLARQTNEVLSDQEFYRITFSMDMREIFQPLYDEQLLDVEMRARVEVIINRESLLPHRLIVNCESCFSHLDRAEGNPSIEMDYVLSGINEPVYIPNPAEDPSLLPTPARVTRRPDTVALSEWDDLQAAIDAYMADQALTSVPARAAPGPSTNDYSSGGTLDLRGYLRTIATVYYYCWDKTGLITQQDGVPATCPLPSTSAPVTPSSPTVETIVEMSEGNVLQAAVDTYMADQALTSVSVRAAPGPSTNDFSSSGMLDLTGYLHTTTTVYYYCWDHTGLITQEESAPATCPVASTSSPTPH